MRISSLHIDGYRSLRNFHLDLEDLTVVVGANGVGKTNLYRALELLQAAARGRFSEHLSREGGMPSALWAGERRKAERRRMHIAVDMEGINYELVSGLVPTTPGDPTAFRLDPDIKSETLRVQVGKRSVKMASRSGTSAEVRDQDGKWEPYERALMPNESLLSQLEEPHRFPELSAVRQAFDGWRFYHEFRSDHAAPARQPQIGVRTPVLAPDGSDLGAALRTIIEIGAEEDLAEAVSDALPGCAVDVEFGDGRFEPVLRVDGMKRPLRAREMSDGQLRYLCLVAALLSPRPPSVFALNEPETSIHPDLIEPLARLVVRANERSQVWVTTHSQELASLLKRYGRAAVVEIEKVGGVTRDIDG